MGSAVRGTLKYSEKSRACRELKEAIAQAPVIKNYDARIRGHAAPGPSIYCR